MIPDEGWNNLLQRVIGWFNGTITGPHIWDKSDGFLFIDVELNIPPFITLEYFFWGGKARNFWEIFHLTAWNIHPHVFFGLPKDVGGGSSGSSFHQTLERVNLPTNLQSLTFGSSFHQTLERVNLPNSLQNLTFSLEFNHALERPL